MRLSRAYCVALVGVFLLSFVCLSVGINKVRIASTLPDPISKIPAQDESLYSHIAIHMATEQNWLTPMFLGRYLLYKPPLLVWLSGLSMKVLGVSLFSLRLPLLLAGALAATLIFIWLRRLRPDAPLAAAVAFLLLVSNRHWHVFYRICQADGLLATAIVGSLLCLLLDPRLEKRLSLLIFAIFTAAAILSKSVAGFLPLGALLVYCALQRGGQRPSRRRAIELFLLTGAFALPWHLYQLIAHPRWFWADYVQLQLLSFGLNPPSQVSAESHLVFYLKRLFLTDPVLVGFALVATPSFVIAARRRDSAGTTLLFSWLAVSGIGLLAFQYRNAHYLLSVIPALCILAAGYGPLAGKHRQLLVIAGLCTLFFAKVYFVNGPWRLNFRGIPGL